MPGGKARGTPACWSSSASNARLQSCLAARGWCLSASTHTEGTARRRQRGEVLEAGDRGVFIYDLRLQRASKQGAVKEKMDNHAVPKMCSFHTAGKVTGHIGSQEQFVFNIPQRVNILTFKSPYKSIRKGPRTQ